MTIPDYHTYLLRNLYAGQKAIVRNEHETMDWFFKLGKEYIKADTVTVLYLTYMQSTSCEMLDWMKHTGIKIARRTINNLRYADDTTLMGESVLPILLLRHLGSSSASVF